MPKTRTAFTPDEGDGEDTASNHLNPATFGIGAWVGGVVSTVRSATLYQRADLVAVSDELQQRLRIARAIPDEDRAFGEESPESIQQQLEDLAHEFEASAMVFKLEGRSKESRDAIELRLKKQGIKDEAEVTLHQLADAVVAPEGVTVEHLRTIREVSEAQYAKLLNTAVQASGLPPRVDVPFSSESSADRRRGARS